MRNSKKFVAIMLGLAIGFGTVSTSAHAENGESGEGGNTSPEVGIEVADPPRWPYPVWYEATFLERPKFSKGYINYSQPIGDCNLPCGFGVSTSATRSIGVTLGLTRWMVAARLGISEAETQAMSTTCTGARTDARRMLAAYPVGTKWTYRVRTNTYDYYNNLLETKTETLVAFNPEGIRCVKLY